MRPPPRLCPQPRANSERRSKHGYTTCNTHGGTSTTASSLCRSMPILFEISIPREEDSERRIPRGGFRDFPKRRIPRGGFREEDSERRTFQRGGFREEDSETFQRGGFRDFPKRRIPRLSKRGDGGTCVTFQRLWNPPLRGGFRDYSRWTYEVGQVHLRSPSDSGLRVHLL